MVAVPMTLDGARAVGDPARVLHGHVCDMMPRRIGEGLQTCLRDSGNIEDFENRERGRDPNR